MIFYVYSHRKKLEHHMRKLLLYCLLAMMTVCISADKLPVLRVSFPGSFKKDMDYIHGNMSLTDENGHVVELPAKFKTRGATALNYSMKPSFNMKLRTEDNVEIDSTLLGLRSCSSWILDAMAIDQICMRNRVCFDVWNAFSKLPYPTSYGGRNGTIGKFVEVYINDKYTGIYCLNDRVNRKLLDLKKVKSGETGDTIRGGLYKHGTTDYGDQSTPGFFCDYTVYVPEWHDAWELTYPDELACEAAWEPLVNYYKSKKSYAYVSKNFFEDNLVDYALFIAAFSISDNWGNKNSYFSVRNMRKDDDKAWFVITPWDLDTSLGGSYNGSKYGGNYTSWGVADVFKSASPPFSTCLSQASFKNRLKQRWIEAREGALAIDSVADRLYKYCDLFYRTRAWQRQRTWMSTLKYKPKHCDDLRSEVNLVVQWYQNRFAEMDEYFGVTATGINDATNPQSLKLDLDLKPVRDRSMVNGLYDLQGRKIKNPVKGHLYIKNGKKILY